MLLAKIDLYDEDDVQEFINCTELDRNFIVLKKQNVKDPLKCRGGECNQKVIVDYCSCNLKVFSIRPHTFEIIGAIWPFFEMVAISQLNFKEVQQIVDHIEKILNLPIIEKN